MTRPKQNDELADLRDKVEELVAHNEKLCAEREQYRDLYMQMLELNKKLERGILGQKAEKLPADESQLTLQLLAMVNASPDALTPPALLSGRAGGASSEPSGSTASLSGVSPRAAIALRASSTQK